MHHAFHGKKLLVCMERNFPQHDSHGVRTEVDLNNDIIIEILYVN